MHQVKRFAAVSVALIGLISVSGCTPVGAIAGIGATIGAATVDERGLAGSADDAVIRVEINGAWAGEDATAFTNVGLMIHDGYVVLTGTVAKPETRLAAVRLAQGVKGVKQVNDHIRIDPNAGVGQLAEDGKIVANMRRAIFFDGDVLSLNFNIDASDHTLFLQGIAQDLAEKRRVMEHAYNVPGVRYVVDYIRIKDPEPLADPEKKEQKS